MKFHTINRVSCVLCALCFLFSCSVHKPEIAFDTEVVDLGIITRDTSIMISIIPINVGEGDLTINEVTSDCHCTVPKDFRQTIKPQDKGEIKIVYNATDWGYFEQIVNINSNAINGPSLIIIKGRVKRK